MFLFLVKQKTTDKKILPVVRLIQGVKRILPRILVSAANLQTRVSDAFGFHCPPGGIDVALGNGLIFTDSPQLAQAFNINFFAVRPCDAQIFGRDPVAVQLPVPLDFRAGKPPPPFRGQQFFTVFPFACCLTQAFEFGFFRLQRITASDQSR